jgi:hypothetical protein
MHTSWRRKIAKPRRHVALDPVAAGLPSDEWRAIPLTPPLPRAARCRDRESRTRGDRNLLYVGLRHSRFKANFKFVGGNEDFDVTSTHWASPPAWSEPTP